MAARRQQSLLTSFFGNHQGSNHKKKEEPKSCSSLVKVRRGKKKKDSTQEGDAVVLNMTDLSENERECVGLIKTFLKGGLYARSRLSQVIGNIWIYYQIENKKRRDFLFRLAKRELFESEMKQWIEQSKHDGSQAEAESKVMYWTAEEEVIEKAEAFVRDDDEEDEDDEDEDDKTPSSSSFSFSDSES